MTTAGDVVSQALKKSGMLGLGQTADASDLNDALADLGDMLAQWSEKRWLVWHMLDFAFISTGQTTPYTVGPTGNFAMSPRPSRISAGFVRQIVSAGLNVDYPLTIIPSREEYDNISLKALSSFPKYLFYDSAFPTGNLYVYPWPNATSYELHITVTDVFPVTLTSPTSFANYPPFTIPAMKFNLARRLRQAYGKGLRPDPELNAFAKDALETIRAAQTQIPELQMPRMLIYPSKYNILSDQYY